MAYLELVEDIYQLSRELAKGEWNSPKWGVIPAGEIKDPPAPQFTHRPSNRIESRGASRRRDFSPTRTQPAAIRVQK